MIPYKDDNPVRTIPYITFFLVALNIFLFFVQLASGDDSEKIVYLFGAVPHNILTFTSPLPVPPVLTLFTSMFLHGGILHIAGNMLYLWIFGNNIEERLGHFRYLVFYLFSGVAAAYSHALAAPSSEIPMIGASGAISGVLGAYILLFPFAKVRTLLFFGFFVQTVSVPALIVIGFWAIIQIVNGLISQGALAQGGIAWFAHIGGFLAGLLTIKLWLPRRNTTWS